MTLNCTHQNHPACAEPLEERCLLSGSDSVPSFQPPLAGSRDGGVEVVEVDLTNHDGDVDISLEELPSPIVAAIKARFADGQLIEAAFSDEDGAQEFDVTVESGGQVVSVSFTPDGTFVDEEATLASREIPQAVLDWVRRNMPGAEIDEALQVTHAGIMSYQLQLTSAQGQEVEATLRVHDADTPESVNDEIDGDNHAVSVFTNLAVNVLDSDFDVTGVGTDTAAVALSQTDQASFVQSAATYGGAVIRAGGSVAPLLVQILRVAADGQSVERLPQIAGVLSEVMQVDWAKIEGGLQQLLTKIDSLAENVVTGTFHKSEASKLVLVGALVAGSLLVLESKKNRSRSVVVPGKANSSWSWVLGSSTTKRR